MKWVKRGLWIAMWCCWVWCGFGLARELPRFAKSPLAQIGEVGETCFGFLPATEILATGAERDLLTGPVRLWDAREGRELKHWESSFDQAARRVVDLPRLAMTRGATYGKAEFLDGCHKDLVWRDIFFTRQEIVGSDFGPLGLAVSKMDDYVQHPSLRVVVEIWDFRMLGSRTSWITSAFRGQNGRVRWRLWNTHNAEAYSDNGSLWLDSEFYVHDGSPPPLNYPLVALCQTILALPLALLWAGLKWRRRRRGRQVATL
jgi:hypothetical protein